MTSIKYDNAGRKINMDDPDMGKVGTPTDGSWAWTYAYDALGNLSSQTDARLCQLTLLYDALNRRYSKSSSGNGCSVQVTSSYTYDQGTNGKGFRTGMTDASGSAAWTYDTRGRMLSEAKTLTGASTYTTSWSYNSADLPVTMTYPDNEVVTNSYNDRMLLNSVIGTNTYVSSTNYDTPGRMTSRALGNTLTQNFTYYGWTETATVDSQQVGQGGRLKNATIGSLQNLTYVYDAAGNIRSIQDSLLPETQSFGYDTLDRLTSANVTGSFGYSETYAYNATSGNLTTKGALTLAYGDSAHVHAVTTAGTNTYTYDANGNQTKRIINGLAHVLKYDAENRLVSLCQDTSNNGKCDAGETVIAAFTFDGDGKRVKSVINGTTTLFVGGHYEVKNPGAGQEVSKYYFAGASRIAMRKYTIPVSMAVEYFVGDHLGSTSLTTDTAGSLASRMRYKAWGELRSTWTSGVSTTPAYILPKHTYTGQYSNVDDFGLMFYNARWYDPYITQFSQPDSIIPDPYNPQDWNRYSYVRNNPLRYTDPSGHIGCDEDTKGKCINYEYKKFNDSDIQRTIIHIAFGSMIWPRDGDGEPRMSNGFQGLGTAVGDRNTIVTADHILQSTLNKFGDAPYMFIWGEDAGSFTPIPMDQVTSNTNGDLLVLRLPDTVDVPQEFLVANSAVNYAPKPLQPLSVAYQDENGSTQVTNTSLTLISPVQVHVQYGTQYAGYDFFSILNQGDSGGGVFFEGGLIGVNSAIAPYPGFNIQPLSP